MHVKELNIFIVVHLRHLRFIDIRLWFGERVNNMQEKRKKNKYIHIHTTPHDDEIEGADFERCKGHRIQRTKILSSEIVLRKTKARQINTHTKKQISKHKNGY